MIKRIYYFICGINFFTFFLGYFYLSVLIKKNEGIGSRDQLGITLGGVFLGILFGYFPYRFVSYFTNKKNQLMFYEKGQEGAYEALKFFSIFILPLVVLISAVVFWSTTYLEIASSLH